MIDYEKIVNSISSLIIEVDLAGNCKNLIQTNSNLFKSFIDYYSTNPNRSLMDYILSDKHKKDIQEALADKNIKNKLFKYIEVNCNSSNKRYFFNIILNRSIDNDNIIYVILTDVTEYLDNHKSNLNESQFLHCLEYANIVAMVVVDCQIRYFNKNITNLFGWETREISKINYLENVLCANDFQKIKSICEKRKQGYKEEERYTVQLKTKTGEIKNIEVISHGIFWDNQPASLVFFWDVSEKETYKRNESYYKYIFENTQYAIELCTIDGLIIDMNLASERMWNVSRCDVINKVNIFDLKRINTNFDLYKTIQTCILTKKTTQLLDYQIYVTLLQNQTVKWLSTTVYPILDSNNNVTHFAISNEDLTKKKIQEEERELLYTDSLVKKRLFEALASISYSFLECNDETALQSAIQLIGETLNVSRSYIFKIIEQEDLNHKIYYKYEWCNHHVKSQINNESLNNVTFKEIGFGRWEEKLLKNECIYFSNIGDIPEEERKLMIEQDIKSLLVLPIFLPNCKIWGFIGFDDCFNERLWREHEISILRNLSNMIGSFIRRCKYEKKLRKFIQDQAIILNNIDSYVWFFSDERTYGFINNAFYKDFISTGTASYQDDCLILNCNIIEESEEQILTNRHVFETKEVLRYEQKLTNTSGEERILRIKKIPVLDRADVKYIVCIATDVTEQKKQQKKILTKLTKTLDMKLNSLSSKMEEASKIVSENRDLLIKYFPDSLNI